MGTKENKPPDINELLTSACNTDNSDNKQDLESLKALELAKIIVKETLDQTNIKSLSKINEDQVRDIVNAHLLNTYFQVPEIDVYILNFLQLKRSENAFLLNVFAKLVSMNAINDNLEQKNLISRIIKR